VNSSIAVGSACARTLRRGALAVCLPAAAFLAATSAGDGSGARAGQPARPDHSIRLSRPRVAVPSLAAFGPLPELRVPLAAPVAPPPITPGAPTGPPAQPAQPGPAPAPAQPPRPVDPEQPPTSEEDLAEDELFEDTPASDTPGAPAADPAASDPPEAATDTPAPAGTPAPADTPRFRRARL
jgi:hypothetical protein